jgi:hypothetical protein
MLIFPSLRRTSPLVFTRTHDNRTPYAGAGSGGGRAVAHDLRAELDELLLQGRHRPIFDRLNHPAWFPPASGLIGEIRVVTPHLVQRSSNRARQQIANPPPQDAVGGKPARILYPLGFEVLVNFRIREPASARNRCVRRRGDDSRCIRNSRSRCSSPVRRESG